MTFKNILVPYDGSKCSDLAFNVAIDIAKKNNSKITIVTCLEKDYRTPWYGPDSRVTDALLKKQKKAVDKNFSSLEKVAKKSKVSISSKIMVVQSIVKSLLSFTTSNRVDLIVIGSHGRTGFDRLLLGSVANGISQKARCPVLIVK
jgi:nucleotide-binding universal stress UspA family protein